MMMMMMIKMMMGASHWSARTYLSRHGTRRGPFLSRPLMLSESRVASSVGAGVLCSALEYMSRHQGQRAESTSRRMLSPVRPEIGTNFTSVLIT